MSARASVRLVVLSLSLVTLLPGAPDAAAQPAGGTITGRVTAAATGQPLPNVMIEIAGLTGSMVAWPVTTSDGGFTAPDLPPGHYYARARHPGYLDALFWNQVCATWCNILAGTPIRITAGGTTGFVDFALQRGGHITGTVTWADGGDAFKGSRRARST